MGSREPAPGTRIMTVRLTEALIEGLTPADRDQFFFDSLLATFGYRLTPQGRGIFFVGKPRRTIGYRPPLKVSEAREQAHHMLADIREGRDPVIERKARQSRMAAGTMTVAQLAERWLANYVRPKLKPRTAFDYERLLAQHILPALGRLPVVAVERSDVERLHVAMARTPRRANYTISTTHVVFNHAIDLGLRPPGPIRQGASSDTVSVRSSASCPRPRSAKLPRQSSGRSGQGRSARMAQPD